MNYQIKIADQEWEIQQIHRLNYETFVEEIPQHEKNDEKILIDKFHDENTYIICIDGETLLGMAAVRANRPFSLDYKVKDLDSYLPEHKSICEVRLLSIRKNMRYTKLFFELLKAIIEYCKKENHDIAIISGTLRQTALYSHIGFKPFGPVVGTSKAPYQPMYVTVKDLYDLKG